jgi:phospholipase C
VPSTLTNDPTHTHLQFLVDYAGGKNDGFDQQIAGINGLSGPPCKYAPPGADPRNYPKCWIVRETYAVYSYVPQSFVQPYWTMAARYALADRMFASNNGPSYPSHQMMIAGQSDHVTEVPFGGDPYIWGCDGSGSSTVVLQFGSTNPAYYSKATGLEAVGPAPCFSYETAATVLDRAGISWRYYAPAIGRNYGAVWSAFDAIDPVRHGPDWHNDVISPGSRILTDIASGRLASVSWIVPSLANSDHPSPISTVGDGPDWVASIVNAVGQSKYWKNTAILITWDEWGGLYDHVVPPQYADPITGAYEGLGYRVPLIVVSPWAKHGYVSHVQHETASTLRFIEDTFHLRPFSVADARADGLQDMFDYAQTPGPFVPIPAAYTARYFLDQKLSREPPDDY